MVNGARHDHAQRPSVFAESSRFEDSITITVSNSRPSPDANCSP
jgi:hypothetical protein